MVFEKIAEARSWILRASGLKKAVKIQMDGHIQQIGLAVRENRSPPFDEARRWAESLNPDRSALTSVFISHLDAIGYAYQQMLSDALKRKKRKR